MTSEHGIPCDDLPGADLVQKGLKDIAAGRETAHSAYNALIRRLVSFERALEQRTPRGRRAIA